MKKLMRALERLREAEGKVIQARQMSDGMTADDDVVMQPVDDGPTDPVERYLFAPDRPVPGHGAPIGPHLAAFLQSK